MPKQSITPDLRLYTFKVTKAGTPVGCYGSISDWRIITQDEAIRG